MTSARQQFSDLALVGLNKLRNDAVASIRDILSRELPDVENLQFTIYSRNTGLPVTVFGMDADRANEIVVRTDGKLRSVLTQSLSASKDEYIDWDEIDCFSDDPPKGEPDLGGYEFAARVIAGFLHECYVEAGGSKHRLPAFAQHHDRAAYMDLKTGQWH